MAKMYKSKCKVEGHDEHELKSNIGEDLQDWKARMAKQGHKVGEIFNADYKLSERGYKLMGQMFDIMEQLDSEYEKIEGLVDHKGLGALRDRDKPEVEPNSDIVTTTDEATAPP